MNYVCNSIEEAFTILHDIKKIVKKDSYHLLVKWYLHNYLDTSILDVIEHNCSIVFLSKCILCNHEYNPIEESPNLGYEWIRMRPLKKNIMINTFPIYTQVSIPMICYECLYWNLSFSPNIYFQELIQHFQIRKIRYKYTILQVVNVFHSNLLFEPKLKPYLLSFIF